MSHATENDVKRACLDYLRMRGHLAIRVNSGAVIGEYNGKSRFVRFVDVPGTSDIIGCTGDGAARFFCIETKRPGKKGQVSPAQQEFIDKVEALGGIAIVATSVDDLMNAGL